MAEWALLLLLVPTVVIPVVLLLGFAGCDVVFGLHRPTTIVSAVATSRSSIAIEWIVDETDTDSVRLEVIELPAETALPAIDNPTSPFEVTGLQPGTVYRLRVLAFDDGDTDASDPVFVQTMSVAFTTVGDGAPGDQPNQGGRCVVQRIEPGRLAASGSRVLIFLRGPSSGLASISRIFISQVAATGDPYDSAGDLTRVVHSDTLPDQPLVLNGAGEVGLPIVDYGFDMTLPVLIAFDLTPGFPSSVPLVPLMSAEAIAFFQDNLQEAGIPGGNRTAGYQSANGIALIARIEVG
jgi:hypothetical protein